MFLPSTCNNIYYGCTLSIGENIMALLTVKDNRFREVEEFAKKVERSREDIVDEAIDIYLRTKALERLRQMGREMVTRGVTEEDVSEAFEEVWAEERQTRRA